MLSTLRRGCDSVGPRLASRPYGACPWSGDGPLPRAAPSSYPRRVHQGEGAPVGTTKRSRVTKGLGAVAVTALLGGLAVTTATSVSANTFNVTTTADTGPGSLRQAVLDSESTIGPDTITVQPGLGTINLNSAIVWNDDTLTFQGDGVTVDFGGSDRGFVDN